MKEQWGEKGQKQLSAAQIPSYLLSFPAVFTLFSRLKTRSWSFQLKRETWHSCLSLILSVEPPTPTPSLSFPVTYSHTCTPPLPDSHRHTPHTPIYTHTHTPKKRLYFSSMTSHKEAAAKEQRERQGEVGLVEGQMRGWGGGVCVWRRLSPRDRWWKQTWGGTGVRRDERDKDGDSSRPQLSGDKEDELWWTSQSGTGPL